MKDNKVAIVTGSAKGIGAETIRLLSQAGYSVCINYLKSKSQAEELETEILKQGGNCISVQADVSDAAQVARLFKTVDEQLGAVSVLVNNAGALKKQSQLIDISEERFLDAFKSNTLSCFLCSKEAIKRMSTKSGGFGGVIVNVSSAASKTGAPNEYIDYAASKGAMDTLTIGLAKEVALEGVRVNAVRPGFIDTEIHASGGEGNRIDRLKHKIPLQRGGTALEVANAISWLATEQSSFVTGSFIDVTGGS